VFVDDDEQVLSRVLVGSLSMRVMRAGYIDSKSAKVARKLYSLSVSRLRAFRRTTGAECGSEVKLAAMLYRDESLSQHCVVLHNEMSDALVNGLAWMIPLPGALGIRKIRDNPVPPLPRSVRMGYDIHESVLIQHVAKSMDQSILLRRANARGLGWFSAHRAWGALPDDEIPQHAVLVGSGEGATACCLIAKGCTLVHGIDKTSDLSDSALVGKLHSPGLISVNNMESNFCRLSIQFDCDGLWPSPAVCEGIKSETLDSAPLFLDYSTRIDTLTQDIIARDVYLRGRILYKRVIVRDGYDMEKLAWTMKQEGVRSFVAYRDAYITEVILNVSSKTNFTCLGRSPSAEFVVINPRVPILLPSPRQLIRSKLRIIGLDYASKLKDAHVLLHDACRNRRLSYDSFTVIIQAIAILTIRDSNLKLEALANIFETGVRVNDTTWHLASSAENRYLFHHLLPKVSLEG